MANVSSHQKQILDASVSVARALSGESNLSYRGARLYKGDSPLYFLGAHTNDLTFVSKHDVVNSKLAMQGKIDSSALRLIYSDSKLHRNSRPDTEVARLLYDFCEQIRVESHTPPHYAGVRRSTAYNFQYWSEHYQQNGFTESRLGLLLFTVMQVIHSRVTGIATPDSIAEAIESTRAGIAPSLGHYLVALKRYRYDQSSYAKHACKLSVFVQELVEQVQESGNSKVSPPLEEDIKILAQLALIVDGDIEDSNIESDITGHSRAFELTGSNYRVFGRHFDEVVNADSLVRTALLSELRQKLTDDILTRQINTRRLAAQLSTLVGTCSHSQNEQYLEEGTVDALAITKIITSPIDRTIFYQPKIAITSECAISFLMDCSGSMQKHSYTMSLLMDTILKSVGLTNIPFEILGFSTVNWNGGKAYKQWLKSGQPKYPGRLNDVRHIIFKDFDTHWRRARLGIASLRKPDIFKEGIDGEAIQFACQRLQQQNRKRRVLIVFSDGCPMDTATSSSNDQFYLDNHLKQVIENETSRNRIEIYGVGIGVDLSPYYRKNVTLDTQQYSLFQLCKTVFEMLKK